MKRFLIEALLRALVAALDSAFGRDGWGESDVVEQLRALRAEPPKELEIPGHDEALEAFEEGRADASPE